MSGVYVRDRLVDVLLDHQRVEVGGPCVCGLMTAFDSFAEHIADIYESIEDTVEAARQNLQLSALKYGEKLNVNPYSVLLNEVQWRAGHVEWLRTQLQALRSADELFTVDHNGNTVDSALLKRYDRERDRLDRVVKVAIDVGIAERYVRLAELHGEVMHRVLQAALSDPLVALTADQRVQLVDAMKRALEGAGRLQALDVTSTE